MEPQGIRWFNKDHRGIETEKFITHRTYGTYACEEVEAGDRQGGEGPGHMPVNRVWGWRVWGLLG